MTSPDSHPLLPSHAPPTTAHSRNASAHSSRAPSRIGLAAMDYELDYEPGVGGGAGGGSRPLSRAGSRNGWNDGDAVAEGGGKRAKVGSKKDRRVCTSAPFHLMRRAHIYTRVTSCVKCHLEKATAGCRVRGWRYEASGTCRPLLASPEQSAPHRSRPW